MHSGAQGWAPECTNVRNWKQWVRPVWQSVIIWGVKLQSFRSVKCEAVRILASNFRSNYDACWSIILKKLEYTTPEFNGGQFWRLVCFDTLSYSRVVHNYYLSVVLSIDVCADADCNRKSCSRLQKLLVIYPISQCHYRCMKHKNIAHSSKTITKPTDEPLRSFPWWTREVRTQQLWEPNDCPRDN